MALHRLSAYNFNRSDRVILDTNVLLLIHFGMYGDPGDRRIPPYSRAVSEMIQRKSEIVVLDVVVTEFINAAERIAARDWGPRTGFAGTDSELLKAFRQSGKHHAKAMQDIRQGVEQMLRGYKPESVGHEIGHAPHLVSQMERTKADLTDVLIAGHCESTGGCALTDDGDFQVFASSLDIISNRYPSE